MFLIRIKLEECDIPKRLSRWHWVKYFEENGYQHLMRALQHRAQTLGITLKPVSSIPSLSTELAGAAVSSLEVEAKKPPASIPSKSLTEKRLQSITINENITNEDIAKDEKKQAKETTEKQQNISKNYTHIYGSVQGLILGEHNIVTLVFQNDEKRIVPFLAPPRPVRDLLGRNELILHLKQQLFRGQNLALSALNGLPGVGKTALAVTLAHDPEVLGHFCDGVLWAGLGREPNVFWYLNTWGRALGVSPSEMRKSSSINALEQIVHSSIGTRRMLLVIDDAWSVEAALAFKLGGPYCAYLITTRFPEVAEGFAGDRPILVKELHEDDGLTLLEQLAPGLIEMAPDQARDLVRLVGGLPLPLTLMGNYLRIQMHTGQPRRVRAALDRLQQVKERLQLSQPQAALER